MAKVKIQGHASGTGVLTIAAPNTSTDRTITLPDATGTLLNSDGDGSNLTGISSVGGATGVDFNDNTKARFGTGNDLEIYHDGTHSFIKDVGTGDLRIKGTELSLRSDSADEPYINCTENAGVSIFHNNVKKIETTANGVLMPNNSEIRFKDSGGTERTSVMYDSSNALSLGQSGGEVHFVGGGTYTTRFKIVSGGHIAFGGDGSQGSGSRLTIYDNSAFRTLSNNSTSTSSSERQTFRAGGSQVGSINAGSGGTSYNTSSDYRLKENVDYDWDATTRLKQLKPARFNWISDDTNTLVDGFIAHEVSSVVPESVSGEKDALEEDGSIKPQGIDQAKLVPLLVKTIQELEARIETLENA